MTINRAALLLQLLQQLQLSLADSAQVSMLRLPDNPSSKPQVLISLSTESIVGSEDDLHMTTPPINPQSPRRKLQFTVQTQIEPTTDLVLMQTLDALAEGIELALLDKEEASLWMTIRPQTTDFQFASQPAGLSATMVQAFELSYVVLREELCITPPITEIYLSNQGDSHDALLATIPTT